MDNLAKIRRWISKNDYESIGAFLDQNREMDMVEFDYLNKYVPQEKKEAWNKFVEKDITLNINIEESHIDLEQGVNVYKGPVGFYPRYSVTISIDREHVTPFGNPVKRTISKDPPTTCADGIYLISLEQYVGQSGKNHIVTMYHNQTFKFDL